MTTNHLITLAEAQEMTKRYAVRHEEILERTFKNKKILPQSETFDREALDRILLQVGCEKVRIYFGMDVNDMVKLLLVGVNTRDEDMISSADPVIMENGIRCPPTCTVISPFSK